MSSLNCISDAKINCCKDGKCRDNMCPDSHHCCWQKTDNPILGLCVKRDKDGGTNNCDRSRGLPIGTCSSGKSRQNKIENYERVLVSSNEGYNSNTKDSNKKIAFYLLLVVLFFLLIYIFYNRK